MRTYFETITDPRQSWKIEHDLHEILIMTICAVMSGCEIWEEIVDFCKVKRTWFQEKLGLSLENGLASHDTFQRVFQLINPQELEDSFIAWVRSISVKTKGEVVSIDGKTLRGSRDAKAQTVHMVSAWANANQLVLGQVKVKEKSNEIVAIPTLLDLLDLENCIVTIDAMGCQREIAGMIAAAGADYVLGLKGNHGDLHEDVQYYFENEQVFQRVITREKGHGRVEMREYFLETDIDWLASKQGWADLAAIGVVHSRVWEKEAFREEKRYFITSLAEVEAFSRAVRAHWGIENSLHWQLDVTFNEDKCRTRKDHSAENFSVIRRIALNALKRFPAKMSLNRKKRKCHYDADFMAQVLLSVF